MSQVFPSLNHVFDTRPSNAHPRNMTINGPQISVMYGIYYTLQLVADEVPSTKSTNKLPNPIARRQIRHPYRDLHHVAFDRLQLCSFVCGDLQHASIQMNYQSSKEIPTSQRVARKQRVCKDCTTVQLYDHLPPQATT
jgi:hypothetical protein